MAGEDEDITIDLKLRDYLTGSAATAAREMEELADNTKQAARALLLLDKRADKAANSLYKFAAATQAANSGMTSLNKGVTTNVDTLKKNINTQQSFQKNLQKTTKSQKETEKGAKILTRAFKMLTTGMKLATTALFMLSKMMAIAAGAAVAGNLVIQLLAVVSALSSMVSFAALAPLAIGGLITTVIAAKLAFGGLGEAIKAAASGDAKQLEKAFAKLGPDAKKFVKELTPALKLWKGMKDAVQGQFLSVLSKDIPAVVKRWQPIFRSGLRSIAAEFGLLFNNIAKFFNSAQGDRLLGTFFQAGVQMVGVLRKNIGPLLDALAQIVEVVKPYWDRFIESVTGGFANFSGWLESIAQNGQLKGWLDTAIQTAKSLWDVLKNIGGIIKGILDAAGGAGAGAGALGLFGAALGEINKWANSLAGQTALKQFFSAVSQVAQALSPIITIIANTIGTVLAPAIAGIVQGLAPGFIAFLQALSGALMVVAPYLPPLAEALGQILIALVPLLDPLAKIGVLIAKYLTAALQVLAPVIGVVAQALATLLAPFLDLCIKAFEAIEPYIPQFTALLTQMGQAIMPLLVQIGNIFAQYFSKYLEELATEILPELMPKLMELAQAFSEWLLQALQMLMPYMPQIAEFMVLMMERSAALWPIIFQLATIFLKLATAAMPIGGIFLRIIGFLLNLANGFNRAVNDVLRFISRMLSGIQQIPGKVRAGIGGVVDAITAPFRRALEIVRGIIADIKSTVSNMNLKSLIGGAVSAINPFRFAGGPVEGGKAYTVGELGKEMWVGKNGQTKMVGTNGMDMNWRAPGSGMIIPNAMLSVLDRVERSVRGISTPESPDLYGSRELARLAAMAASGGETHHWHNTIQVTVEGDAKEVDLGKIERAVNKAMDKIEKDRKERRG